MFETLGGLPAHPLFVHIPVILVPLATIGVLAMAVRRSLLRPFGVVVTVLAGVGFLGAVLAAQSGEALEDTFRSAGQTIPEILHEHAEMGESAQWLAGLFFLLTLGWVLFARWRSRAGEERATAVVRKPRLVTTVLMVLALVSGAVGPVSVTMTGHNGAKSVWEDTAP